MGAGKIIAIIAGILGILAVVLFHVAPEIFSFWRLEGGGAGWYLGGFAYWDYGIGDPESADDMLLLALFVMIVAGGAIEIVGAFVENKIIATIGGILMLLGAILFIVALAVEFGDFKDLADFIEYGTGDRFLLFGSGAGAEWGLWIGTYLAIGAGVVGLVGGLTVED
ncbi:MAG: hypothetical protein ACFFA0_02565 [Promethearchaeota archaeon]